MKVQARRLAIPVLATLSLHAGAQSPPAGPEIQIVGRVIGQDGEPARNARVQIARAEATDQILQFVHTDGDGMFASRRLPRRHYSARATASGMTAAVTTTAGHDGGVRTLELRLWDARTLHGRVVDGAGRGLAGVAVVATKDEPMMPSRVDGATGADGNFALAGVPIGAVTLRAWLPGHALVERRVYGWTDERIDLVLTPGGIDLHLRVVGLPPAACAEATLRLQAVDGWQLAMPLAVERPTLAADGTCSLRGLPLCEWTVSITHPSFQFLSSSMRAPRCETPDPLTFHAEPIATIDVRGTLRNYDGPMAWQILALHPSRLPAKEPRLVLTDETGAFAAAVPAFARHGMCVELLDPDFVLPPTAERAQSFLIDPRLLGVREVLLDGEALDLVATAARAITGRIVDAAGMPQAGVDVELESSSIASAVTESWQPGRHTTSGNDGTFTFRGLADGSQWYRVRARRHGEVGVGKPVQAGAGPVPADVVLAPGGRIEGVWTDADGEPCIGEAVLLLGARRQFARTDDLGRFAFLGLEPGNYRLATTLDRNAKYIEVPRLESGERLRIDIPAR